jgi:hypothetical protein
MLKGVSPLHACIRAWGLLPCALGCSGVRIREREGKGACDEIDSRVRRRRRIGFQRKRRLTRPSFPVSSRSAQEPQSPRPPATVFPASLRAARPLSHDAAPHAQPQHHQPTSGSGRSTSSAAQRRTRKAVDFSRAASANLVTRRRVGAVEEAEHHREPPGSKLSMSCTRRPFQLQGKVSELETELERTKNENVISAAAAKGHVTDNSACTSL